MAGDTPHTGISGDKSDITQETRFVVQPWRNGYYKVVHLRTPGTIFSFKKNIVPRKDVTRRPLLASSHKRKVRTLSDSDHPPGSAKRFFFIDCRFGSHDKPDKWTSWSPVVVCIINNLRNYSGTHSKWEWHIVENQRTIFGWDKPGGTRRMDFYAQYMGTDMAIRDGSQFVVDRDMGCVGDQR